MSRLTWPLCGLLLVLILTSTSEPAAPPSERGDPLPRGAVARMGSLRYRLPYDDFPVALSPDGKRLYTFNRNGAMGVCDLSTGASRRLPFPDEKDPKYGNAVFSPACDRVLIRTTKKLIAYDVTSGKKLWSIPATPSCAFDPTGKYFARYEADDQGQGEFLIHRADNGKKVAAVKVKGEEVHFALGPGASRLLWWDGKPLKRGMRDAPYEVAFHDVTKGKEIARVPFYSGFPRAVFRPDGKQVAIAANSQVAILDADGKRLRTLRAAAKFGPLQFSPDGKHLAAIGTPPRGAGGCADLWEVDTWKRLPTQPLPEYDLGLPAFPARGRLLVVGIREREVVVADALTGKATRSPAGHSALVSSLSFDGSRLRTAGDDGKVAAWDRASGRLLSLAQVGWFEGLEGGLAFTGSGWVVSGSGTVYDLKAGRRRFEELGSQRGGTGYLRVSRDDVLFVAGIDEEDVGRNGTELSAVRVDDGELLWSARVASKHGHGQVAVSPDGKTVAMLVLGDEQSTVYLFDAASGKPLAGAEPYRFTDAPGRFLDFSGDGRHLVGATGTGLFVLDARTGAPVHSLKLERALSCAALCPLGRTVALSLLEDGEPTPAIHVYEISSGKVRLKLDPGDPTTALCFSLDGKQLASGHDDGTTLLWNLEPEQKPSKLDAWKRLSGEDAEDAYRATWQLRRDPERAVELVKKHVKPSPRGPSPQQVKRLLAGLDDDEAKVRDESELALKMHGRAVESMLRRALKARPSTEVKRRVNRLLGALPNEFSGLTPSLRGVELLEGVGTKEAREALAAVAKGDDSSRLTREAKAALARLTKRD